MNGRGMMVNPLVGAVANTESTSSHFIGNSQKLSVTPRWYFFSL